MGEDRPRVWKAVRAVGLNILVVGLGGGMATNMADDVPMSVLAGFPVLAAAGGILVWAAHKLGGQSVPRFWATPR